MHKVTALFHLLKARSNDQTSLGSVPMELVRKSSDFLKILPLVFRSDVNDRQDSWWLCLMFVFMQTWIYCTFLLNFVSVSISTKSKWIVHITRMLLYERFDLVISLPYIHTIPWRYLVYYTHFYILLLYTVTTTHGSWSFIRKSFT